MQTQWDKPGYGNMFKNKSKAAENHPDFTGRFVLEFDYKAGEVIEFGMWKKTTKAGDTFFSMRADSFKKRKNDARRVKEDREVAPKYDDSDIPF